MSVDKAIVVKNLSKSFIRNPNNYLTDKLLGRHKKTDKGIFKALYQINFEVDKGQFFGIVGKNGSGKSTLLRIILGSIPADKGGNVMVNGKAIKLSLGMGFNNLLTARDNIYINGSIIGLSFKEIGENFDEILDFAEVSKFVDTPIKYFSSGMKSRLAFSIALKAKADIFLMDEFFGGVGDIGFKKKSQEAFRILIEDGKTIVLVSHSMKVIKSNCSKVLLLNKGKQISIGTPNEIIPLYKSLFRKQDKIDR